MIRLILHFSISLLTFFVGIASVDWTASGVSETVSPKSLIEKPLIFKPQPRYHYFKSWAQDYELSAGKIISIHCQHFDSSAEAAKHLSLQTNYADTILERSPKLNANGQRIGERIVAAFPPNDFGSVWIRIIWTDGAQLYTISSLSLPEALEFERTVSFREIYLD